MVTSCTVCDGPTSGVEKAFSLMMVLYYKKKSASPSERRNCIPKAGLGQFFSLKEGALVALLPFLAFSRLACRELCQLIGTPRGTFFTHGGKTLQCT